MCTNGINTSQLEERVKEMDELIALARRWTHRMYHMADDASMERTARELSAVQNLLDDVRSKLDEARDAIERDDRELGTGVEVRAL